MIDIKKLTEDAKQAKELNSSPIIEEMRRLNKSAALGTHLAAAEFAKSVIPQYQLPKFEPPPIPKFKSFEEINEYSSAKVLLQRLNAYYTDWSAKIEDGCEVRIYALLPNGANIEVKNLTQEGFNGIAIEGVLNDAECLLLTHQASLQFLCVAEKITEETPRQKIGFVYQ